jgi:hypothetical protein
MDECNPHKRKIEKLIIISLNFNLLFMFEFGSWPCRNPSFGLVTKVKGLQGYEPRRSSGVKARRSMGVKAIRSSGVKARRSPRVTSHTPGSVRSVREWTLTLPRQLPLWEMDSRETSESDFRGQNSMSCGVFYIIGKLLERRCLKWACIVHLDIWNTSYGQKKGWESNCQFDS